MAIRFPCPACSRTLSALERRAGTSGNCPGCGEPLVVPDPLEETEDDDEEIIVGVEPASADEDFSDADVDEDFSDDESSDDDIDDEEYATDGGRVAWVMYAMGIVFVAAPVCGLAASIWLAIEGEWRMILGGFALAFIMPWAYIVLSLPSMAGLGIMVELGDQGRDKTAVTIGFVTTLYDSAIVIAWALFVFCVFSTRARPDVTLPAIALGYATAMAPLAYMGSKEKEGEIGSVLGCMASELAYIVFVLLYAFGVGLWGMVVAGVVIILIHASIATTMTASMLAAKRRLSRWGW